jgi:DNA-binding NtrC family response regulator
MMDEETKILVVDDEAIARESLSNWLKEDGYTAVAVGSGADALERVERETWNVIFLDIKMPGMDGMEVLKRVKAIDPDIPVLMITAYATVETAVQAMKSGAYDYIIKPFDPEAISLIVKRIIETQRLARENVVLRERIDQIHQFEDLIGKSQKMQEVFELVRTVAESDSVVMITGESGTGKELVARAIHSNSGRRYMPFIAASIGALPENLVETALFGHEKGAFTGAQYMRKGRFELADGGTLFLDEIGEIGPKTQVDLLRVLETQQITRVGGTKSFGVDVRIISATNRDLEQAVKDAEFREDLYYRLNVVPIHIPPLRERKEDIPLLAQHFLKNFCLKTSKKIEGMSRGAMELLMGYDWPGNVRELANAIERAVVVAKDRAIVPMDLMFTFGASGFEEVGKSLKSIERSHIEKILQETEWNITRAAEVLEIDRVTLYNKIKKYGLKKP